MLTKGKIEIDVTVHGENSFEHKILRRLNRVRDEISDMNKMTNIQINISKDKKNINIEQQEIKSKKIE